MRNFQGRQSSVCWFYIAVVGFNLIQQMNLQPVEKMARYEIYLELVNPCRLLANKFHIDSTYPVVQDCLETYGAEVSRPLIAFCPGAFRHERGLYYSGDGIAMTAMVAIGIGSIVTNKRHMILNLTDEQSFLTQRENVYTRKMGKIILEDKNFKSWNHGELAGIYNVFAPLLESFGSEFDELESATATQRMNLKFLKLEANLGGKMDAIIKARHSWYTNRAREASKELFEAFELDRILSPIVPIDSVKLIHHCHFNANKVRFSLKVPCHDC